MMDNDQRRKERLDRGIKIRSDGLYALMSWRELLYLILPRLALIVGLLILPLAVPGMYWQRVISIVCIYALLALSFDLLAHFVGLVSLGGAFFIGTGGYIAAILNTSLGLPPLVSIPVATLLGAVICTLCLVPCLPLRGVYFAIVTLMYPLLLMRVIEALNIFGGTLHANPFTNQFLRKADAAGTYSDSVVWPQGVPAGTELYLQFLVQDFSVPAQITLSNAQMATTP